MKKIITLVIALAGGAYAQAPVVVRNTDGVFLSAAPTGDCRQSYYNLVIDNSQNVWACNESVTGTGAWTAAGVGSVTGLSIASGKTLTVSNSMTLAAGADGQTWTFPSTSDTVMTLASAQTVTGVKTLELPVVADATDATKTAQFSLSGATTGTKSTLTFAQTVNRVITFPDAAITVPGTVTNNCATANACSATNVSATAKIVVGITAALNGASPAIATVTGMPAFTSSSSYVCTANVNSASASTHVLAVNYVSSSSVTFTGANGATDTVSYSCIGS